VQRRGGGVHSTPQEVWCVVTVTDFPLGSSFIVKEVSFFLAKDRRSLENEVLFYG
jgi:hypothetical protein